MGWEAVQGAAQSWGLREAAMAMGLPATGYAVELWAAVGRAGAAVMTAAAAVEAALAAARAPAASARAVEVEEG